MSSEYQVGDLVSMDVHRSAAAIWLDRIRHMRWNVPTKERIWFKCVDTRPGAMWPQEPA